MSDYTVSLAFSNGYFVRLPYFMLQKLPYPELVMLAYLINWYDMKGDPKHKGWFFCKMKQIMYDLNVAKSTQSMTIKSLAKKGYLKTRTKGWPSKRWIKLDMERIRLEIEELIEKSRARREKIDKQERRRRSFKDDDE